MNFVKRIDENLRQAIAEIAANKEKYVQRPGVDFTRNRKLPLSDTMTQILFMNGGSLNKELYDMSKRTNITLTPSAFVQQRSKISSSAFKDVFYTFNAMCHDIKKYRNYRLIAVDGTDLNCPRNPQSKYYLTTRTRPEGYNMIHVNALYDICNQTYIDIECQAIHDENERTALINMLHRNNYSEKTLFICDRGYESYNVFAHFINTENVDFLCRVHNREGAMFDIRNLPMQELDEDIAPEITTTQTNEDKRQGRRFIQTGSKSGKGNSPKTQVRQWDFPSPYSMKFRVVRFLLDSGEYETLATSLSREEFSLQDLKELYHMRWSIETSFRTLKYAVGIINLHSKKDDLILQEIFAAVTVYNFCTRVARSITVNKQKKCKYVYEIDLKMAIYQCKLFCRSVKRNYRELMLDLSRYINPVRLGRKDKRKLQTKRFVPFVYRVAA